MKPSGRKTIGRRQALGLIGLAGPAMVMGAPPAEGRTPPEYGTSPLPGEPLGLVYPRRIRELLSGVRARCSENILEAAHIVARAYERGNTCWSIWDQGHTYTSDMFPGRWGLPEIFTPGYDPSKSRKGDVFLAGYPFSPDFLDDAKAKGVTVVGSPTPWSGDPKMSELATPGAARLRIRPYADIWIETDIDIIGAQVRVPGSWAPLGPESGPLMGTIFWMIAADACRELARIGKKVPVLGDEPPLPSNAPRRSLDSPVMGDFADDVSRLLERIAMEYGDARKTASIAVDTLMNGGYVYFYSRYPESFASEATGRRGGFAFVRALSDGKPAGTSKDFVIMGIYAPDDPVDLANFDRFKAAGMRIASVGPAIRGGKQPAGRSIAHETEAHTGRMSETYGLVALPGFERKICPVSGVLNTAILWTISGEIAAEIIARTGDSPGIYFNGAITWDDWWDRQVRAMYESRGY